jgi:beta-lactam-binding protein with PASTA domain
MEKNTDDLSSRSPERPKKAARLPKFGKGPRNGSGAEGNPAAKPPRPLRAHFDFSGWTREQKNSFTAYVLLLCAVFLAVALLAFFLVLRAPEKVLVPDVRQMELADALLKLQERELYPRLSLRFTDNPQDKNTVLEQSPAPGAITKAGRRIKLTVSRGAVLDKIENYAGQDLETVRLQLQALFSSSRPLVTIREPPLYRFDDAPAGTILQQQPAPGERISGPAVLELIVSKGPESPKADMPAFTGMKLADAIATLEKSPFIADFSMRLAKDGEAQGVVVDQEPKAGPGAKVKDRIKLVVSSPATAQGFVNGIYVYSLPEYPYPVPVKLETIRPTGQRILIASLKHPGGNFSMPFSLPAGSLLVLSALDRELARTEVKAP